MHRMAKDKQRASKSISNRHLHARATFLYQAATYRTLQATAAQSDTASVLDTVANRADRQRLCNQPIVPPALQLGSHLRSVSKKGQVQLSTDIKRTICKKCNAILIPGRTCTHTIENKSKGGLKPWADVLEVGCNICGAKKRFPVGAARQSKKKHRHLDMNKRSASNETPANLSSETPVMPEDSEQSTSVT
jgi:ribonuclease P protein subunit RPR2